jgi:hypothetical protein
MQDSVLEHGCMLRMEFGKAAASIFVTYLRRGLINVIFDKWNKSTIFP